VRNFCGATGSSRHFSGCEGQPALCARPRGEMVETVVLVSERLPRSGEVRWEQL
jgi:hypothetical protein